MLSILYGLSSALVWGAADFCGGIASRRAKPYQAVLFGEITGLIILSGMTVFIPGSALTWQAWLMCGIAGAIGVLGLLLFFHSLSTGQMSIAAPVSALTATLLPIVVGSFIEGFPGWWKAAGFVMALVAIWFISQPAGSPKSFQMRLKDLAFPLIAGVGFGTYLVLIELNSQDQVIRPMIVARIAGILTMLVFSLIGRKQVLPRGNAWPFIALYGLLDISGNGLFILAGQSGRLDVAAVLVSLYPASTVLLAWLGLHEKIDRLQVMGILAALAAILLMTV